MLKNLRLAQESAPVLIVRLRKIVRSLMVFIGLGNNNMFEAGKGKCSSCKLIDQAEAMTLLIACVNYTMMAMYLRRNVG